MHPPENRGVVGSLLKYFGIAASPHREPSYTSYRRARATEALEGRFFAYLLRENLGAVYVARPGTRTDFCRNPFHCE